MNSTILSILDRKHNERQAHLCQSESRPNSRSGDMKQMQPLFQLITDSHLEIEQRPRPAYLRPLGSPVTSGRSSIVKARSMAESILHQSDQHTVTVALDATTESLVVTICRSVPIVERELLATALQAGRVQFVLSPPPNDQLSRFQLSITVYHDLDVLWTFEAALDAMVAAEREVLMYLTQSDVWSVRLFVGTQQNGIELMAGFEQFYMPPMYLQSMVECIG